jgi:hypothetical protein
MEIFVEKEQCSAKNNYICRRLRNNNPFVQTPDFSQVEQAQQNWVHKGFGKHNYYMSYDKFRRDTYFYSGYNNPLSLWDR